MPKSLADFMRETGGDLQQSQRLFQESRKSIHSPTLNMSFSESIPKEGLAPTSTASNTTTITANIGNNTRVGYTGIENTYNPYTGGTESITPNIGVNEGQYNMYNKQNMWERYGNSGNFEMNAFYRGQDGSLQIRDEYKKNLKNAQNIDDINSALNQNMITSFENRNIPKATAEGFAKYNEKYKDILMDGGKPPKVYSAVEDMTNRRREYGVDALEEQMNAINKQMADLKTNTQERVNYASNKAIPMGAIAGRVSTIEQQGQTRLEYIRNEANYLNDQYKTKMNVIDMFMKAGEGDYERAKTAFDDQYKRNRDMLDMYNTQVDKEYSRQREQQKDAQATIQTIYNGVMSGSINKENWTPQMEMQISKLELQAGFPMGLIKSVYDKNPKSDIIQQSTAEVNGRQVLNLVMRDKATGEMRVENIDMGAGSTPKATNRYQYKDGMVFDTQTGSLSNASVDMETSKVQSIIDQCSKTAQCGSGVNDYLEKRGLGRLMGNTYSSKQKHINSSEPQIGGLAIWQPSGGQPQYGHVGIVIGEKDDKVLIHDWNWNDDEQQREHWVPKSAILKNGGFMHIGSTKTGTTTTKEDTKQQDEFQKMASSLVGEMYKGTYDFNNAHAQMYSRFGNYIKSQGHSDAEVKNIIYNALGGDNAYRQYQGE